MRKRRAADLIRDRSWFDDGFNNWDDKLFKKHFRFRRDTFNFLLTSIEDNIRKKPTSMKPTESHQSRVSTCANNIPTGPWELIYSSGRPFGAA